MDRREFLFRFGVFGSIALVESCARVKYTLFPPSRAYTSDAMGGGYIDATPDGDREINEVVSDKARKLVSILAQRKEFDDTAKVEGCFDVYEGLFFNRMVSKDENGFEYLSRIKGEGPLGGVYQISTVNNRVAPRYGGDRDIITIEWFSGFPDDVLEPDVSFRDIGVDGNCNVASVISEVNDGVGINFDSSLDRLGEERVQTLYEHHLDRAISSAQVRYVFYKDL